ncbi:MAG: AI-2E family transporter [Acidobacteria bacterium]|nr:AI-2E family transporter [Acidobacteriota bacterium]
MLGIDSRAARAAWSIVLVALALALAYWIRRTLLIFTVALLVAYLLSPLVELASRVTQGRVSRNLSLTVVYVLLVAVLGTALGFVGSRVVDEAASLAARLPDLVRRMDQPLSLPLPEWVTPVKVSLLAALRSFLEQHSKDALPLLRRVGSELLALLGNLLFVILVPILSFFFLKDGPQIGRFLIEMAPPGVRQRLVEDIFAGVHLLLAQFMRALVLLSLGTFVSYSLFFVLTGVPYALLLATVAGLLEFIPVLGPFSAAAAAVLVAGFSGYDHLVWLIVFFVAYRLFQDYVLQPYLMSSGVELHPLLVIFGVLAGEQVAGVAGMFLSIPVIATLRVIFVHLRKAQAGHNP